MTYRQGLQNEWQQKSRERAAQVVGADAATGQITLQPIGATYDVVKVDAPVNALAIQGQRSSWQRYMPQKNEFVSVWWDQNNQPHAGAPLSYIPGRDAGFMAAVLGNPDRDLDKIFRQLKPGEFDLRSSGGSGYWFSAQGHAKIHGGGTTSIDLDESRNENIQEAALYVHKGDGCEQRLGDVKRAPPLPLPPFELSIPLAKEWSVKVGQAVPFPTPALPQLTYFDQIAGDARDALGAPILGSPFPRGTATPLRYRQRVWEPTGFTPVHAVEVDAAGNVSHISSVGSLALYSPLPAGGVWLGSRAALAGVALGEPTVALLTSLVAAIQTLNTALAIWAGAVGTGFGLVPGAGAAVTASGAAAGVFTGLETVALPAISSTLAAAPGTLFSLKVRCDP